MDFQRGVSLTQLHFYSVKKVNIETKIIVKFCNNIVKSSAEIGDLETYQGNRNHKCLISLWRETSIQCFTLNKSRIGLYFAANTSILPKVSNNSYQESLNEK